MLMNMDTQKTSQRLSPLSRFGALYEVSDSKGRILPMEGMRGLAVGLVFFVHYFDFFHAYITPDSALHLPFYFLSTIGNLGVDLFFVISDYLIYGILLRQNQSYARFWKRRVVRIYPVFLVAFVIYLLLSLISPEFDKIGSPQIGVGFWLGLNVLLLPGIISIRPLIMVAWSLSYEFLYYLFSPLVVGGLRMWKWAATSRVALVLSLYAIGYSVLLAVPDERGRLLLFLVGILVFECKRAGILDSKPHPVNQAGAILCLSLAFYIYFGFYSNRMLWDGPRLFQIGFNPLLVTIPMFSVAFFYFCVQAFRPSGFIPRVLSWKPLRYLGNMSYTVYLFHVLALEGVRWLAYAITPPSGNQPGLFLGYCLLGWIAVWVLSTLVFLLIEKPVSLTKKSPATS